MAAEMEAREPNTPIIKAYSLNHIKALSTNVYGIFLNYGELVSLFLPTSKMDRKFDFLPYVLAV